MFKILENEELVWAKEIVAKNYGCKIAADFEEWCKTEKCLGLFKKKKLMAFLSGQTQPGLNRRIKLAWVNVEPSYQRQGLGTKIVSHWLDTLEEHTVVEIKTDKPRFYEALDFKKIFPVTGSIFFMVYCKS